MRLQQSRVDVLQPCGADMQFMHVYWRHLIRMHYLSISGKCHCLYCLYFWQLRGEWNLRYLSLSLHHMFLLFCLHCLFNHLHIGQ